MPIGIKGRRRKPFVRLGSYKPTTFRWWVVDKGAYNSLSSSYEIVLKYVEDNGYKIIGPIRESYIDGIWNKEDESEWLTEIQIPID